eukprot:gene11628-biopygen19897
MAGKLKLISAGWLEKAGLECLTKTNWSRICRFHGTPCGERKWGKCGKVWGSMGIMGELTEGRVWGVLGLNPASTVAAGVGRHRARGCSSPLSRREAGAGGCKEDLVSGRTGAGLNGDIPCPSGDPGATRGGMAQAQARGEPH